MAKFAKVGYGHDGRGLGRTVNEETEGYTYLVNDNVRTGDVIQPVATSKKGRKFATTGKILHSYRENSVKGQEAKADLEENAQNTNEATRVYSGKELGVSGFRGRTKQEQMLAGQYEDGQQPPSKYTQMVRAGNLKMYMQDHPRQHIELTENAQQTFDEYAKKFMN